MIDIIWDYDKALEVYKRYSAPLYIDAERQVGETDFYDSLGNLVYTPTGKYSIQFNVNEPSTSSTCLTTSWGKIGDKFSDLPYPEDAEICLCVNGME